MAVDFLVGVQFENQAMLPVMDERGSMLAEPRGTSGAARRSMIAEAA